MVGSVRDYAIFMLGPDGRVRTWNSGAQRIKGYAASEIVGQHFSCFYPPADREEGKPEAELETARREGRFEEEGWRMRKDGTLFVASVVITTLYDEHGDVCGFTKVTRDITERKKQEEALRDSERFMRSLIDALPSPVAVLDSNARILACNRVWREYQGDLLGVPLQARHDGASFLDACRDAADHGNAGAAKGAVTLEKLLGDMAAAESFEHLSRSSGAGDWYLCRMARFPGEGPVRVVISYEDITAIKRAQEKAEREEARFRDLFEYAPDGIVMTDARGVITLVNRQAEAMFHYRREELLGQTVETLMPEENRVGHVGLRERYLSAPVPRPMGAGRHDLHARRKDGSVFPVDICLSPLEGEQGRCVVAGVRDATARVTAQEKMRQAMALLDAISDGAFMLDPETLRFTYANHGLARLLNCEGSALLEMLFTEVSPGLDRQELASLLSPLVDGGRGEVRTVVLLRSAHGQEATVEISFQYVTGRAERCFIGVARNISERLIREQKERRTQRLESIGTLAGGLAHDLNNALTPVLMTSGLLKVRHPGSATLIEQMEASARHASDMVRQLLMFARGAEGPRVAVNPAALLNEVLSIVRGTFPKSIDICTDIPGGLLPVACNATQMHQVLLNLCLNARDAMPGGGMLTIKARNDRIEAGDDPAFPEAVAGPCVILTVKDTGTGMTAGVVERIFEPFFSTKDLDKGTGLGLSTVLGIVRSHGGLIRVQSALGQGSIFSIFLPAAPYEGASAITTSFRLPTLHGRNRTILVVDDEITVRHVIEAALEELDFKVVTAAEGKEALSLIANMPSNPAVIITDSQMPTMDGLTLVQMLAQCSPGAKTIVMSGHLDERTRRRLIALGTSVILEKPFFLATLVNAVREALGEGPAAPN